MKIALSFLGCHTRGGVERLLLETANHLAGRGHDVHVYAADFNAQALHPGVARHPVPAAKRPALLRMLTYARNCQAGLEDLDSDVHGSFGVISPPGGVFNVQSVHRAWIEASRRLRKPAGRLRQACNPVHPFLLSLERKHFAERRYRKLIVPTEQVRADLRRYYNVPERDVVIIPNGYAPALLNPARGEMLRPKMRGKLGYNPGDFVILFVANELERKGFPCLLRAVASMDNPRLRLLAVVGRVNTRPSFAAVRRLGLEGRVRIVGSQNDLTPWYAAADVLALPTQYEAWGLVIVEALACGTPVLTSRLAGAAVAVREGSTGALLDNPCDIAEIAAKLEVLSQSAQPDRTAVAASVECFSWANVLNQYERVLQHSLVDH
ncbi:MAG: glycosyltransferase family 4 protein [Chthoniobacteraceae bacterium]|nr:glycosyltransferase family 4 protein [Chthoniobacteraceae bacterium]